MLFLFRTVCLKDSSATENFRSSNRSVPPKNGVCVCVSFVWMCALCKCPYTTFECVLGGMMTSPLATYVCAVAREHFCVGADTPAWYANAHICTHLHPQPRRRYYTTRPTDRESFILIGSDALCARWMQFFLLSPYAIVHSAKKPLPRKCDQTWQMASHCVNKAQ